MASPPTPQTRRSRGHRAHNSPQTKLTRNVLQSAAAMQHSHMAASLARKPLLEAERCARRKAILVTGATGYIGSRVVERLLACGHAVHVLARPRTNPGPEDVLLYLQTLPGAREHLTVVTGDVMDTASLCAAMSQCEQLVHLAAVVDVRPPRDEQHKQQMIDTALAGTRIVLDAASASGSITKVILASSIVAIMWDWWERGRDHVYTEEDWTLDSSVALNCYAYCKRESERLAYKLAEGARWELATINPGIVFGPVARRKLAESASVWQPIVQHMNGSKYPYTSNLYVSHVDLDDVAAAICGLLATPGATGRHLLMSGEPPSMPQIARLLSAAHPTAKVAFLTGPWLAVAYLARFRTHSLGFDFAKFRAMHNKPYRVDASKIQRVLPGFNYIPLAESAAAAADSVVALGLTAQQHPAITAAKQLAASLYALMGAWWGPAAAAVAAAAAAAVAVVYGSQQQQQAQVQQQEQQQQTQQTQTQQTQQQQDAAAALRSAEPSAAGSEAELSPRSSHMPAVEVVLLDSLPPKRAAALKQLQASSLQQRPARAAAAARALH